MNSLSNSPLTTANPEQETITRHVIYLIPWLLFAVVLGCLLFTYRNGEAVTIDYSLIWFLSGLYVYIQYRRKPFAAPRRMLFGMVLIYAGIFLTTIYLLVLCSGGLTQLVLFQLFLIPASMFLQQWTGRSKQIVIPIIFSYIILSMIVCISLYHQQKLLLKPLAEITDVTLVHQLVEESPSLYSMEGLEVSLVNAENGTVKSITKDSSGPGITWNFIKGRNGVSDSLLLKDERPKKHDSDSTITTSIYRIAPDASLKFQGTTSGTTGILSSCQPMFSLSLDSQWIALDKKTADYKSLLLKNVNNGALVEIPDCGTPNILKWTNDTTLEILVSPKSDGDFRQYQRCSFDLKDQTLQCHATFALPSDYRLNTLRSESHAVVFSDSDKLAITATDGSTSISLPGNIINRAMDWNSQSNTVVYLAELPSGKQEVIVATANGIQDRLELSESCTPLNVCMAPDESKILYLDRRKVKHPLAFARVRIWDRKSGSVKTLANLPLWETFILSDLSRAWMQKPVWSPDGKSFTILGRINNVLKKKVISTLYRVELPD